MDPQEGETQTSKSLPLKHTHTHTHTHIIFWGRFLSAALSLPQQRNIYWFHFTDQEKTKQGQAAYIAVSGWFIFLPQFLSPFDKNLEQWTKRFKTRQVTAQFSSSRQIFYLKDTLKTREQADPRVVVLIPFAFPLFILPIPSLWLCPMQNRACIHHQSMKGNVGGHTQGRLTVATYVTAGSVVYVFP